MTGWRSKARREPDPKKRFMLYVRKTSKHWLWRGGLTNQGYGEFHVPSKIRIPGEHPNMLAHRFSYELFVGPIPDGQCVLHECDEPRCVWPKHLFLGTKAENSRDMAAKNRSTKWPHPHPGRRLSLRTVRTIRRAVIHGTSQSALAAVFWRSPFAVIEISH